MIIFRIIHTKDGTYSVTSAEEGERYDKRIANNLSEMQAYALLNDIEKGIRNKDGEWQTKEVYRKEIDVE